MAVAERMAFLSIIVMLYRLYDCRQIRGLRIRNISSENQKWRRAIPAYGISMGPATGMEEEMFDFATDLIRIMLDVGRFVLGVGFGILAIALTTVIVRVLFFDNGAYEANRRVTPKNLLHVWSGNFGEDVDDKDNRTSRGLALNLKTGKLHIQRRLSDEAIDDVIGRRV